MLRLAGAGLLVVTLVAAGVACGSGRNGKQATPALREYFDELAALDQRLEDGSSRIDSSLELLDSAALLIEGPDLLREELGLMIEFRRALELLQPPEEAEDEHERAVGAMVDFVDAFDGIVAAVETARTLEAFLSAFEDDDFTEALDELQDACRSLQRTADDYGIDIMLSCRSQ